jgi:hypothetical protein
MSVFPHRCPKCGSPAYVGLRSVECTNPHCPHAGPMAKARRKVKTVSSFVCWSSDRGGPPCAGIVVVADGTGVCPDCGSHYAAASSAFLPALP